MMDRTFAIKLAREIMVKHQEKMQRVDISTLEQSPQFSASMGDKTEKPDHSQDSQTVNGMGVDISPSDIVLKRLRTQSPWLYRILTDPYAYIYPTIDRDLAAVADMNSD